MTYLKSIKASLFAFILVIVFAACNSNGNKPSDTRNIRLLSDSSALHNNSSSSDTAKQREANIIHERNIHHENASGAQNSGGTGTSGTVSNSNSSSTNSNSSSANSGTVSNSGTSTSTHATHKKGWSKAAKGAVIGGAAGAVGGAIISHKGTGAAIGAAVGAAGGYIIGRDKDKKDGRVQK